MSNQALFHNTYTEHWVKCYSCPDLNFQNQKKKRKKPFSSILNISKLIWTEKQRKQIPFFMAFNPQKEKEYSEQNHQRQKYNSREGRREALPCVAKGTTLILVHQVLLDWPFPAFPWASPTILSLTLHRCGALSWLVMPTLFLPTLGFASAVFSTFSMLSFLSFTINSYPPSQLSSPFPGEAFPASLMGSKAL